jgi:putative ABC transport system permease protein
MSLLHNIAGGLRGLFRKEEVEQEMDEELRGYLDSSVKEKVAAGMNPAAALRTARQEFGSLEAVKENTRAAGWEYFVESFWQDIRFGMRMLRKSPSFTIIAVLTLALGIGATTAIFSVVNTVLLKSVPYPDPDRIVLLKTTSPSGSGLRLYFASDIKFNLLRQQTSVFQDVSGYRYSVLNLTGVDHPEQIQTVQVTGDYFHLFGLPIAQGRIFTEEEERPNGRHVAILSDGIWKRAFGGDPRLVGKTISLGGDTYEVVGIVAPGVQAEAPDPASAGYAIQPIDVWIPFPIDPSSNNQVYYFISATRLKPGVTVQMARAQLQLASEEFHQKFPNEVLGPRTGFDVQGMFGALVDDTRLSLLVLVGAVGFMLLIACANVANLLLVRATSRKREITMRAAIGAGRGRIIRQLLTESLMLSLAGGALGLAVGVIGIRTLLASNPGNIPRIGDHGTAIAMDWRVFFFTVVISLVTGILFGLIPALQVSRADLTGVLKEGGGRSGSGFRQNKARSLLVIGEMSLTIVLLVGAVLLMRTFIALRSVNPGFDVSNVLTLRMSLTGPRFQKTSEVDQLIRDGVQRLDAIPGVVASGSTNAVPLEGNGGTNVITVVGRPLTGPNKYHGYGIWISVSPGYFDVFKIPLLRGRLFTEGDDSNGRPVVIINKAMARAYWPDSDPLNDQVFIGKGIGPEFEEPARQIIGIVGDVHDGTLYRNPEPAMYVPESQLTDARTARFGGPIVWVVRTRAEPLSLTPLIQTELLQATGGLPVGSVRSMEEILVQSTARQDFNMSLMTAFGSSALLLSAIGIYGVMAYVVAQRTHEIGIRMALGAMTRDVSRLVLNQGAWLALTGVSVGIIGALALTRLLKSFLFGVTTSDPFTFVAVPFFLLCVSLLACYIPARRATRVDPMVALRHE